MWRPPGRSEHLEAQEWLVRNHDLVSESAGLEYNGILRHQLEATNALGGPSCCWSPCPPRAPGFGLSLSQGGLEVQMEALQWGLEVPSNWKEPAACLQPQPESGTAENPLFRGPRPSAAFSTVPLKALTAAGRTAPSFGYEEEPPPGFTGSCSIYQASCKYLKTISEDEVLYLQQESVWGDEWSLPTRTRHEGETLAEVSLFPGLWHGSFLSPNLP